MSTDLDQLNVDEKDYLKHYDVTKYERPSLATDIVAFSMSRQTVENYRKLPITNLNVLLVQRGEHPYKYQWALPGGFVKPMETIEQTALRELQEETGITKCYMEQLYTFSEIDRDPRTRVVTSTYLALLNEEQPIMASTDTIATAWFEVQYTRKAIESINDQSKKATYLLDLTHNDIHLTAEIVCIKTICNDKVNTTYEIVNSNGIAFDHAKIIAYAIERMRNKVEYTDIVFHLLPETFTIKQLQRIFEIILDKDLLDANFRRKIAHLIEKAEGVKSGAGHRAAQLYKQVPAILFD